MESVIGVGCHGPRYLEWVAANSVLTTKFNALASALRTLFEGVQTPEQASDIWLAAPAVLSRCNQQSTYEMPGAPYAYAWLHLLDRYARTWQALEKLVEHRCLPMARNGVRTLDVGTGPGPSAFAIHDFYAAMTEFGAAKSIAQLNQPPSITCVEFDQGTNRLRHHLAEIAFEQCGQRSDGVLALCHALSDFRAIVPTQERLRLHRLLRWEEEEYFDEGRNEWVGDRRYSAEEANDIAQSLHRYRLIVFSNFLTKIDTVRTFEANLVDVFTDAQPGSVILVLGGRQKQYSDVYEYVDRLATAAGFQLTMEGEEVSSAQTEVADRIFAEGAELYARLQSLAPNTAEQTRKIRSHFTDSRIPARVSQVWAFRKHGRVNTISEQPAAESPAP